MKIKFKKTYLFALLSSLYITVFSSSIVALLLYIFFEISWDFLAAFAGTTALFSFLLIQYRVEHFIYRGVKKICPLLPPWDYDRTHKLHAFLYIKNTTSVSIAREARLNMCI